MSDSKQATSALNGWKVKWKFKATFEMINCLAHKEKGRKKCCVHGAPRGISNNKSLQLVDDGKEDYFIESHKQKSSSESINRTTNNFD